MELKDSSRSPMAEYLARTESLLFKKDHVDLGTILRLRKPWPLP